MPPDKGVLWVACRAGWHKHQLLTNNNKLYKMKMEAFYAKPKGTDPSGDRPRRR